MKVEPIRTRRDIERMEHVLRYYSYRDWFAFKFGINTSLRAGDLLKITVAQVKNRHLMLREAKTRKIKKVFINDSFRPIIDDYIKYMSDDDYLFRGMTRNEPIKTGAFYRTMRDASRLIGLENIGTHSCRKTFAYHFYRERNNLALLMELLNHSNERETLIYIGIMQDELDEAMATYFL